MLDAFWRSLKPLEKSYQKNAAKNIGQIGGAEFVHPVLFRLVLRCNGSSRAPILYNGAAVPARP
jgi:hypothetical protein